MTQPDTSHHLDAWDEGLPRLSELADWIDDTMSHTPSKMPYLPALRAFVQCMREGYVTNPLSDPAEGPYWIIPSRQEPNDA